MGILKRCGGSNVCHFTKIIQRACISVLAYNGVIEQDVRVIRQFRPEILATHLRRTSLTVFDGSRRRYSAPTPNNDNRRRTSALNVPLPPTVQRHLAELSRDVKKTLNETEIEKLRELSDYCFVEGGKLIRPTVVLLMAGCCTSLQQQHIISSTNQQQKIVSICNNNNNDPYSDSGRITNNLIRHQDRITCTDISESQRKVALVSEMIHTASLVHDDVIDEADQRRGRPTLCAVAGNKSAILVGDYILAKATQLLTTIGDADVIALLAQVIEDLVKGEFMQLGSRATEDERFTHYMSKTFKKTASLFAHSCKAVAKLAGCTESVIEQAYEYGKNLGLAFQLIDDTFDFIAQNREIGKPTFVDLRLGLATAPVLFACRQHPELNDLILRRFSKQGDVDLAYGLILQSDGLLRTRQLAEQYCKQALDSLQAFPDSAYKGALRSITTGQTSRDR